MKKILTFLILAAVLFTGCSSDAVVAKVNGEPIYQSEVDALIDASASMYAQQGITKEEFLKNETVVASLKQQAIDSLIDQKVLVMKATELGAKMPTAEELAKTEADAKTQLSGLEDKAREIALDQKKTDANLNLDKRVDELVNSQLMYFGLTRNNFVKSLVDASKSQAAIDFALNGYAASDADLTTYLNKQIEEQKAAYEANNDALSQYDSNGTQVYYPTGSVYVKHVLVKIPDEKVQEASGAYQEDKAKGMLQIAPELEKIKPQVDSIYAKAIAGEDFEALIAEFGQDEGMTAEPYKTTGYLVIPGSSGLMEEFRDAALKLKQVGELSEPVATLYGYHILKCVSVPTNTTLATMSDDFKTAAENELKNELINETIAGWKATMNIEKL